MSIIKKLRKQDLALLLGAIVLYAVLYFLMENRIIPSFWRLQIILIGINIILAASLNLINGITGQFSLGHAGFMAVGAYVSAIMTMWFGLPFGAALIIGGLAACLIGILIGIPTLRLDGDYPHLHPQYPRRGRRLRPHRHPAPHHLHLGILGHDPHPLLPEEPHQLHLWQKLHLRPGERHRSGRHGHQYHLCESPRLRGRRPLRRTGRRALLNSYNYLTMVVLGGLGSMTGSITGAALITLLTAALADYPEVRMIIYALCLILLMLFRPQGLFGKEEASLLLARLIKRRKEGKIHGDAAGND